MIAINAKTKSFHFTTEDGHTHVGSFFNNLGHLTVDEYCKQVILTVEKYAKIRS